MIKMMLTTCISTCCSLWIEPSLAASYLVASLTKDLLHLGELHFSASVSARKVEMLAAPFPST